MTKRILKTYGGGKRRAEESSPSLHSTCKHSKISRAPEEHEFKISKGVNEETLQKLDQEISKNIDFLKESLRSIEIDTPDDDPNSIESIRSNLIKELFLSVKKPGRSSKTYLDLDTFKKEVSERTNFKHFKFLLCVLKLVSERDFVINDDMRHILSVILTRIEEQAISNIYAKPFIKNFVPPKSMKYTYVPDMLYFELQNKYLNAILNKYSEKITKENDMKLFIDNRDDDVIKCLTTRNYSAFTANTIVENLINKLL